MPQTEHLVTVAEVARVLGVPEPRVRSWVFSGKVPVVRTRRPLRISLAAASVLLETTAAPDPSGEYVPPYVAAQVTGVRYTIISGWGRNGMVASRPGPHGQLVRLADVQEQAAQYHVRWRDTDAGREG